MCRKVLLGEAGESAFPVNFPVQTLCVQADPSMRAKMSLISRKEAGIASLKGTSMSTSYTC